MFSWRKNIIHIFVDRDIISTDEDPGLLIGNFAIIKIRCVSTKINNSYT